MSDVMLHGVLCMPPDLWGDDPLDVAQRYQRYLQASQRIEDDGREIERLHDALAALLALPVAKKELESLRKGIGTATPNAAWLHAARLLGDT